MGEIMKANALTPISFCLLLCVIVAHRVSYKHSNGSLASELELREWAVRLYKQQPVEPATTLDNEYKMSDDRRSTHKSPALPSERSAPPLAFIGVWKVLDVAARANRLSKEVEAHTDLAEGSVLTAIAQKFRGQAPIVCLAGFHTGHASIVWLESSPGVRVVAFDEFQESHQRGSRAFINSLYPQRLIPLPGNAITTIQELTRTGLSGLQCDIVHIDSSRGQSIPSLLKGFIMLASKSHTIVLTGAACKDKQERKCDVNHHSWDGGELDGKMKIAACHTFLPIMQAKTRKLCIGYYASVS